MQGLSVLGEEVISVGYNFGLVFHEAKTREDLFASADRVVEDYTAKKYMTYTPERAGDIVEMYKREGCRVFIAKEDSVVGTICPMIDSRGELDMDLVFKDKLDELRGLNKKLAEMTYLASTGGRRIFFPLMAKAFAFCFINNVTDICISIHPTHKSFYQDKICFKPLDPNERPHPKVNNAPALGMALNVKEALCNSQFLALLEKHL